MKLQDLGPEVTRRQDPRLGVIDEQELAGDGSEEPDFDIGEGSS
jgi:hypothetical protein